MYLDELLSTRTILDANEECDLLLTNFNVTQELEVWKLVTSATMREGLDGDKYEKLYLPEDLTTLREIQIYLHGK